MLVLLVAIVPVAIYWNTLRHGFVFDDLPGIVDYPLVRNAIRFRDIWPILGERWRPLVTFSYAATHVLFGFTPAVYHATNVALHLANTLLVYGIAFQVAHLWLPRDRRNYFAAAASLVFAAHPLHTEAVAYVWGRSSSLCAFFCFGSLFLLLLGDQEASTARRRVLLGCALVCGLAAWKCKEEAITLPLVLAGFLWLAGKRLAAASTALVPLAVVAGRWSEITAISNEVTQNQELVLAGASPALPRAMYFMTEVKCAVFYYLGKFVAPANLNVDPYVEPVKRFYEPGFLAACLVLLGCVALAAVVRRREPALSFSTIVLLVSPLASYAFMPLADPVAEHRVYISGLGFALITAWIASLRPRIGVAALALLLTTFSLATYERNKIWADNETLWRDAERKSPQLARPHINLGVAYQAAGRWDEAAAEYAHAITVNPRLALAYSNMSSIYLHRRDPVTAEAFLNEAIKLSPGRIGPYVSLAGIKLQRGQPREAIRVLDEANKLGDSAVVHFSRGEALFALGHYLEARQEYDSAVQLDPGSTALRQRVASRLREMEAGSASKPLAP